MEGIVVMHKPLGKRALIVGVFLLTGVLFAAQSFGIAQDPSVAPGPAAAIEMDWALMGVLIAGALIILVRPRRRYETRAEKADD